MKKKLYTLFASIALLFAANTIWAQVTVTYQVDVTNYINAGNTIASNGVRIAGTFGDLAGANGSAPMVNWSPTDAGGAMTDMGSNVWSIDVAYPSTSIGLNQLYKFVNGDWGTNEGTDTANTIGDGCGTDDGAGNINRTWTVTGSNVVLQYCWDHCTKCDGGSSLISSVPVVPVAKTSLNIVPTLATDGADITYSTEVAGNVNITVRSFTGQVLETLIDKQQAQGEYNFHLNTNDFANGMYFVTINSNGTTIEKRFVVNR